MKLPIILIMLLLRRHLDARQALDLAPFWRKFFSRFPAPAKGLTQWLPVLVVLLAAGGLFVLDLLAARTGFSWLLLACALAFLLLFGGVPAWRAPMQAYGEAWRRGDMQAAWHHVRHLLPPERRGEALAPDRLHALLSRELVYAIFSRYFLLISAFALGGSGLVLLVAGLQVLRDHFPAQPVRHHAQSLLAWLEWIPVRLLALTFALAGDFGGWLAHGRSRSLGLAESARAVLNRSAEGALRSFELDSARLGMTRIQDWPEYGERSLLATRDLLNRSLYLWIGLLSLLAIGGYLS